MGKKKETGEPDMPQQKGRRQIMEFNFAQKMEDLCRDMLNSKKERTNRCKEIVMETHNFLEGFRKDFLQPVRQEFQAAHNILQKFAGEFAKVR